MVSGLAVYAVIWWTVIFLVLPIGIQPISREDVGKGHDAGAPRHPRMLFKVAITTLVAAIIWLLFYWLFESGAINFVDS